MSDKEFVRLDMIVDVTGGMLDNPSLGPPSIRPAFTLNLVDEHGRIVALPLIDTVIPKLIHTLQSLPETHAALNIPGVFGSPTKQ